MLLHQEFTHEQVNTMKSDNLVLYFLNHAAKIAGDFAYAKNGMRLRAF